MDHQSGAPLEGYYLHSYEDNVIGYQGRIIAAEGKKILVQLFSWRDGLPADRVWLTRAFIAKNCKLYTSEQVWRTTGEIEKAASPDWRRWHRPTEKPIAGAALA